jgi:hypothetical protein
LRQREFRPFPLLVRGKFQTNPRNHITGRNGCQDFYGKPKIFLVLLKPRNFRFHPESPYRLDPFAGAGANLKFPPLKKRGWGIWRNDF